MSETASRDNPLENVLERAINEVEGDKVTFGDILDLFGSRSFGPIIVLLGMLVTVPPIGAVPGLPMIVGVIIILFTVQIVFGADPGIDIIGNITGVVDSFVGAGASLASLVALLIVMAVLGKKG